MRGLANNEAFTVFHLEDNYRSETGIVKASASFISKNQDRIAKRIRSKVNKIIPISSTNAYYIPGEQYEAEFIANTINKLVTTENYSYDDITILARNHQQFFKIEAALEKISIPFFRHENQYHYDAFLPVLRAVCNVQEKGMINKAVNFPNMVMDNYLYQELQEQLPITKEKSVLEAFQYINECG